MEAVARSARLVSVSDEEDKTKAERGAEIKRRRLAYGITSIHAFHGASGVSREAITAAENGQGSPGTLERLEAWLDNYDHEISSERDEASTHEVRPADFVEFELTVDAIGLHIIGKGTTANMAEVRKQVADLYREIREKGE
jgi:transcriptional regulator with XRE-family HTH domain